MIISMRRMWWWRDPEGYTFVSTSPERIVGADEIALDGLRDDEYEALGGPIVEGEELVERFADLRAFMKQ